MRVVGTFAPLPASPCWDCDPVAAAGYDPAFLNGAFPQPAHACGLFVVPLSDLYASGSPIDRLQANPAPDQRPPEHCAPSVGRCGQPADRAVWGIGCRHETGARRSSTEFADLATPV